jgi:flagellar export protein FliJ
LKEERLQKELGELKAQQAGLQNKLLALLHERQELQDWLAGQRKIKVLDQSVEQAYSERALADELSKARLSDGIQRLSAMIEAKRLELVEASKEKKAVEKLEENQLKAYLLEVSREEQVFLDELARHQFSANPHEGSAENGDKLS